MSQGRILFTDPFNDIDDAIAIYIIERHSGFGNGGIVAVHGDSRIKAVGTRKLLSLMGAEYVPVHYGMPLIGHANSLNYMKEGDYKFITPADMTMTDDEAGIKPYGEKFAAGKLDNDPGEMRMISIAPLSSLVTVLHTANSRPKDIVIMGGHIGAYANGRNARYEKARIAEYNFRCDPDAAINTLESGNEIYIIGKNLWTPNLFSPEDFDPLASGTEAQKELLKMIRLRHAFNKRTLEHKNIEVGVYMYDPLAAGAVLFPELYEFKNIAMTVDGNGITKTTPLTTGKIYGAVNADFQRLKRNLMELLLS